MRVIIAEHSGFCFGVRRAIELVTKAVEGGEPVSTLGPLIHNPQEVERLEAAGVKVAASVEDASGGRLVLPSHGADEKVQETARGICSEVIDATCPYVAKVHRCVKSLFAAGMQVVVVGDPEHSEVKGILSAAGGDAVAISSPEEAKAQNWSGRKVGIVAQTTQTEERFREIVSIIRQSAQDVRAVDTICVATRKRQEAASDMAEQVDVIFVVGGKNSANTRRLMEICEESGVPTYHVETADEIQSEWLVGKKTAGITAGASTPDRLIMAVKERLVKI